jgi:hypothetical protein
MAALTALGFLDTTESPLPSPATLRGWLVQAVSFSAGDDAALLDAIVKYVAAAARASVDTYTGQLVSTAPALAARARLAAASCTNVHLDTDPLRRDEFSRFLRWCGFFSDARIPLPAGKAGSSPQVSHVPIDTLVAVLTAMPETSFADRERDMVIMQHVIEATFPDGHAERYTASMVEYAHPNGQTAMARTVGLTAGIGAQLLLDGAGSGELGVIVPLAPLWYKPVLAALKAEGIALHESVVTL